MESTAKSAEKNSSPNEQEGKLGQFYLQTDLSRAKLGLVILVVPILGFILNDFELFGLSAEFYGLLTLRLGLLVYTLLQLWLLGRIKNYRAYERSITAWGFALVASIIAVNLTRPASFIPTQMLTVILYIFVIWLVIPNRFLNQLFLSLIVTLGEASIVLFYVNSITIAALVTSLFSLTLTFVIGALSSWQLNSYRRRGFQDINERKKAEEAVRESEQRLKFHTENVPLAVVEWDSNFVVTRWAGDAQKMFGWKADETVGKPIMDLHMIFEPDIPIVEKTMAKLTSGETKIVSSNRNVTKDGRVIHCTWINSVLLDQKGKMISVFSFVEDDTAKINAEKALEENNKNLEIIVAERTKQLKDSERLAAIGATAGMVGHDIRNPLQAITSDVYLVKWELASTADCDEKRNALESLQEIEKNVDYINKIVADLQDFAKPLTPHTEEADLKLLIDRLLEKNGFPQNIAIGVTVEPDSQRVVADADYLNRILFNLVINASQAMPEGGELTIRTCREANDVVISVKDTGVGIPEKVKDKLFTPMFTTKSKGQGFGLAVVKRMTEALGGTVTFESQEGKGTTFTIRLPQKKQLTPP